MYTEADFLRILAGYGKSDEWFLSVSDLQNALIKTGGQIGAVTTGDWNSVVTAVPFLSNHTAVLLPKEALMAQQMQAVRRIVVTSEKSPSESNMEASRKDLVFLKSQVETFNAYKDKALGGDRASAVTSSQKEMQDKISGMLRNSTFKSPDEAYWRGFMDELENRARGLGDLLQKILLYGGIAVGVVVLGPTLLKKL